MSLSGNNDAAGTIAAPWRDVEVSISRLGAGDTLYIRGGKYFESIDATASGSASAPIVIRSYPGEQVILDSGIAAFQTPGNNAWQLINAATGEYRSTAAYDAGPAYGHLIPDHPYENGRVGLVPYDTTAHFRALTDQYNPNGIYVGPGTFTELDGRISIRLRKTADFLETEDRYGPILDADPADPRDYSIMLSQAGSTLFVSGAYLVFQDLIVHPAQRTIELAANTHHVTFDGLTVWMGASAIEATSPGIHHVIVTDCRLYGDAPWWLFYSDMKDAPAPADLFRGTSLRLGDGTHDWEISYNHIRGSGQDLIGTNQAEYNIYIHHNRIENALDDAIELEGSLGRTEIYENLILNGLTALAPGQSSPAFAGPLLVYRNVMGLLRDPPVNREEGLNDWNGGGRHGYEYALKMNGSSHGTRNTHLYHNTILLLNNPGEGINVTPQHPDTSTAANNLLVTVNDVVNGVYRLGASQLVDGNLYWKMNTVESAPLTWLYDTVPLLNSATGLEAQGLGAVAKRGTNPQFASLPVQVINPALPDWTITPSSERITHAGVFLGASSPARNAGIVIPARPGVGALPDSRASLDLGAIPYGTPASEYDIFPFNAVSPSPPESHSTIELRITNGPDDAEEAPAGAVDLVSSDLELVDDAGLQTVGLRFPNVAIPTGATITRAYVQFKADELQSEATLLAVKAQASDDAPPFTSAAFNLSARVRGSVTANWSPMPWTVGGAAGPTERTPELSAVVQEVVNRPGWASGNAIAFLITGTGHRTAEAYEGDAAGAPLLHIEYTGGTVVNQAPEVSAGPDETISLPMIGALAGAVSDDGLPAPPALAVAWSRVSGPGAVTFENAANPVTKVGFSAAGTHVFRLAASDGLLAAADTAVIVVQPAGTPVVFERRVASSDGDAEESALGAVDLVSSDLELVLDVDLQVVGLRFTNLPLPQGANVTAAWVQFKSDEAQAEPTTLFIRAEESDDAPPFVDVDFDLSSRPVTGLQAAWSPPEWTAAGLTGVEQRTSDLSSVIEEITSRPGWASGGAIALLFAGSGHRTAESFEGDPAGAPLLHLEFLPGTPTVGVIDGAALALRPGGVVVPSPARGRAELRFATSRRGPARLDVYDLSGRRIRSLASHGELAAGAQAFEIDGRDARGVELAAGVYFYRLVTADGAWSGRFVRAE